MRLCWLSKVCQWNLQWLKLNSSNDSINRSLLFPFPIWYSLPVLFHFSRSLFRSLLPSTSKEMFVNELWRHICSKKKSNVNKWTVNPSTGLQFSFCPFVSWVSTIIFLPSILSISKHSVKKTRKKISLMWKSHFAVVYLCLMCAAWRRRQKR